MSVPDHANKFHSLISGRTNCELMPNASAKCWCGIGATPNADACSNAHWYIVGHESSMHACMSFNVAVLHTVPNADVESTQWLLQQPQPLMFECSPVHGMPGACDVHILLFCKLC
jgi:hypothetical protein